LEKKLDTLGQGCQMAYVHIFKQKIPITVNFGGVCNGGCWHILWPFDLIYGYLVCIYFVVLWNILAIWYIFNLFWYVVGTQKNTYATLLYVG
jgi:hypothetical protein